MSSETPDLETPSEVRQVKAGGDRSFRLSAVATVLAVVAIALSGWALLKPVLGGSGSAGNYSDAQRGEAKTQACAAFAAVRTGVKRNTSLVAPGGPDDVAGTLAITANARIALYVGGQYLLDRVGPATPDPLAGAARGFANNLMDIGAAATAGALNTDPEQATRLKNADADNTKIEGLCA